MRFLRRASFFLNELRSSDSGGASFVSKVGGIISKVSLLHVGLFAIPVIVILIISLTLMSIFNYKINLMQLVDSKNNHVSVGIVVYDEAALEEYHQLSQKAYETSNTPATDLANTEYKTVDSFNKHIKDSVCKAGYGTRQGVVAAGMSLIGDYIKATDKRLRYDQNSRQSSDVEGIVNSNFYMDCSSFAWWALYNGGFKMPSYAQTQHIYDWAASYGGVLKSDVTKGQAGDFLDNPSSHIMLIVGTYSGGYYVAEESDWGIGACINKRSYANVSNYYLLDMTKYYNDQSNVRSSSYVCPV